MPPASPNMGAGSYDYTHQQYGYSNRGGRGGEDNYDGRYSPPPRANRGYEGSPYRGGARDWGATAEYDVYPTIPEGDSRGYRGGLDSGYDDHHDYYDEPTVGAPWMPSQSEGASPYHRGNLSSNQSEGSWRPRSAPELTRSRLREACPPEEPIRMSPLAARRSPRAEGDVFDRLTNPKLYTGTHIHRFDEGGRGRGRSGRDVGTKGSGRLNKGLGNTYAGKRVKLQEITRSHCNRWIARELDWK